MKILITFLLFLSLSACSTFESARWDNNEYSAFVTIRSTATLASNNCSNPEKVKTYLPKLESSSEYVLNYTKHLYKNKNTYKSAEEIRSLVSELIIRYNGPVSKAYCELKFQNIIKGTDIILEGITKKVRK